MKKQSKVGIWIALSSICLFVLQIPVVAQESLPAAGNRFADWLQRNWLWVAAAILLIILIATMSSKSRVRKTTTTVEKDDLGNVKSVTTTKVEE